MFGKIFSVKNEYSNNIKRKSICILGINFKIKVRHKAILIVEPGGIGDCLFCVPYFKYLKNSKKYKNYKKIFLAKNEYLDFISCYCSESFDKIIPYIGDDFLRNSNYRKYLLQKINAYDIKTVINLRAVEMGEKHWRPRKKIVKAIKAEEKILDVIYKKDKKFKPKNLYTKLIISPDNKTFETERRRKFFEKLIDEKIPKCDLELPTLLDENKQYIAISIMAIDKKRMYNDEKWKTILNYLNEKLDENTELLFIGGKSDIEKIDKIILSTNKPERCINLAGKTPISMLPYILRQCRMLISVETGTVHFAHLINLPTICLCNGSYWNRFQPHSNIFYLYPQAFIDELEKENDKKETERFYCFCKEFRIEDISVDDVIEKIKQILGG